MADMKKVYDDLIIINLYIISVLASVHSISAQTSQEGIKYTVVLE